MDSPGMTSDDSSAHGCTHCLSGARRCPFWTWLSWPPNVSRHDVAVPSKGASLDESLVTTFLAPLWGADLGAQPHLHLCATDASPPGAGACSTPVSLERWTLLYDFSEEQGCSVRLVWDTGLMPRRSFETRERRLPDWWWTCGGSKVSRIDFGISNISTLMNWKHSSASFRGLVDHGLGYRRVHCLVDSQIVLGSVCKGRSSSRRVNFRLRRLGGLFVGRQSVARNVLSTFLGKPQRRTISFLFGWRVADRSPVVFLRSSS